MLIEIEDLKEKEVIIPRQEIPPEHRTNRTMWVFNLKAGHFGYVVELRSRLVALGNHQLYNIDSVETFSPIARMTTFRLLVAVNISLYFVIYQTDINTEYPHSLSGIKNT